MRIASNVKGSVEDWLRRRLQESPGTRVLRSRWPVSIQTVSEEGGRLTRVAGAPSLTGSLKLEKQEDGRWRVSQSMHEREVFSAADLAERDARGLYADLQQQLLGNPPMAGGPVGGGVRWLIAVAIVLAIVLFGPVSSNTRTGAVQPAAAATTPPAAQIYANAAPTLPQRDASEPRASAAEMVMLRNVATRGGISLTESGTAFYVFSDPKCPYCQKLEQTIEQLGGNHKPVILPVAYKPGAKEVAQGVLCMKDRKAAGRQWRLALSARAEQKKGATGGECEEGLTLLTGNMTLFEMMKLSGTPTVITASGRMYSGAGDASVEQLRAALELP